MGPGNRGGAAHPRRACRERFGLSVAGPSQRARGDPRGAGARGAHLRERVGGSRAALGGASRRYDAHDDATVDLWRARLSLTARRSDGNRLTPLLAFPCVGLSTNRHQAASGRSRTRALVVESMAVSRQPRGGTDERWSCCGGLRRRPGGTNHADLLFHSSSGEAHVLQGPVNPERFSPADRDETWSASNPPSIGDEL